VAEYASQGGLVLVKRTITALLICLAGTVLADEENEHLAVGKPLGGGFPINHKAYSCGYKSNLGCPLWVSYHLTPDYLRKEGTKRIDQKLYVDPVVSEQRLSSPTPDEIRESGCSTVLFLSPDDAQGRGAACEKEAYSLANVSVSRGTEAFGKLWRELENVVRRWTRSAGEVWVTAGPIFGPVPEKIASGRAAFPDAFYKIIVWKKGGQFSAIAFKIPQGVTGGKLDTFISTVESVERATGMDFLSGIPDAQAKSLKSARPSNLGALTGPEAELPRLIIKPRITKAVEPGEPAGAGEPVAVPVADRGKVWALTELGVFYRAGSTSYAKGDGVFMDEEEARSLGFRSAGK